MNKVTEKKVIYFIYDENCLKAGEVAWVGSIEDAEAALDDGIFNDFDYFFAGTKEETIKYANREIDRSLCIEGRFYAYLFNSATNVLAEVINGS